MRRASRLSRLDDKGNWRLQGSGKYSACFGTGVNVHLNYLIPTRSANLFVEKLSADGSSVVWKTQIGVVQGKPVLALDSSGRAFVACSGMSGVVRLNSAGAVDTTIPFNGGMPTGIAVDPTGSNVV